MQKKHLWKILFVLVYTSLFTALIFVGKEIFFPSPDIHEVYLEPVHGIMDSWEDFSSFSGVTQEDINSTLSQLLYEDFKNKYEEDKARVEIRFVPLALESIVENSYLPIAESFLHHSWIHTHIKKLRVFLYQNKWDTRGRMKSWNIHMYGILSLPDDEFLSVLIHEFAHYFDIYSLAGNAFWDVSQEFYDISWTSVTTAKVWQSSNDFVSGYALTNQYEDFAESYTYYILHNAAFQKKMLQSSVLQKKYAFFEEKIFIKGQFQDINISQTPQNTYIWDTTKQEVDVKKFLQYLQDAI